MDPACVEGGYCSPTDALVCGEITSAGTSTFTGIGRIDDFVCLDHSTPGPESAYRFIAPADGMVTVTLTDPDGKLDLVQLDPSTATPGCDLRHCTAGTAVMSGTQSITLMATANTTYFFVVDGPANFAEAFTLTLECAQ